MSRGDGCPVPGDAAPAGSSRRAYLSPMVVRLARTSDTAIAHPAAATTQNSGALRRRPKGAAARTAGRPGVSAETPGLPDAGASRRCAEPPGTAFESLAFAGKAP